MLCVGSNETPLSCSCWHDRIAGDFREVDWAIDVHSEMLLCFVMASLFCDGELSKLNKDGLLPP